MSQKRPHPTYDLLEVGIYATVQALQAAIQALQKTPAAALKENWNEEGSKRSLLADELAEIQFEEHLHSYRGGAFKDIDFYGEEKLGGAIINLTDKPGTFVLVDAIDGTDLYERGLSNWCSAATFFTPTNPPGKRIRVAVIALPNGDIYYSTDEDEGKVFVARKTNYSEINKLSQDVRALSEEVRGVSSTKVLSRASVCFYGQKPRNLVFGSIIYFLSQKNHGDISKCFFRAYNLAGIPMIIKLIDHYEPISNVKGIDMVYDIAGQQPHDIVPGAYLAIKVGAAVLNIGSGKDMSLGELEDGLLRPNDPDCNFRYIIASTPELLQETRSMLQEILTIGATELVDKFRKVLADLKQRLVAQ